jgi:hypothetical protein
MQPAWNSPTSPVPPPVRKRKPIFYFGIAGIILGAGCCLLSIGLFIAAAIVYGRNTPQTTSNPPAATLPATVPIQPTENPTSTTGASSSADFTDDFSIENGNWYTDSTNDFEAYYQQGAYATGIKSAGYFFVASINPFPDPIGDSTTTVRGKLFPGDRGEFGIACRYQDVDNFYLGSIHEDQFYLGKRANGEWVDLMNPPMQVLPSNMVDQEGYLTLSLSCEEDAITFKVNDILAGQVFDSEFSSGDIALFVLAGDQLGPSGYYAQALFDDFRIELK